MKKILIIQSRKRPEMIAAEQGEYTRATEGQAELTFVSSLDDTLDWEQPQHMLENIGGVILGGSGEFDFDGGRAVSDPARITSQEIAKRLKLFVEYLLKNDVPTLGICYGHQIISEVLDVPVVNDREQKKVGSFPVSLTGAGKEDKLFKELPELFIGQYGHKDSLAAIPNGAVLLATGERCKTSALRYGSAVYTMQFHPELTAEDVKWKLQNSPGYLSERVDMDSIVKPSVYASKIIPLFIERIVE